MDGRMVQEVARHTALALPGITLGQPFGPDWDVFKVQGKVFLLLTDVPGEPVAIMKCEPDLSAALRGSHDAITAGYHMNKRHWITIYGGPDVDRTLVDELVQISYQLVVDGLPRRARPDLRA